MDYFYYMFVIIFWCFLILFGNNEWKIGSMYTLKILILYPMEKNNSMQIWNKYGWVNHDRILPPSPLFS